VKLAPTGGVYLAVTGLSDYRYDGFSESDRAPTLQTTIHYFRSDGWYTGAVLTGVNFKDTPRTSLETDIYGGRHVPVGTFDLNLQLLYTAFPDKTARGPTYNFVEPQVELTRSLRRLTLKVQIGWSPEYSGHTGEAWHLKGTATYALTSWLALSGRFGRLWIENGESRTHGEIGATATWRHFSVDVRYSGADLNSSQCSYTNWCSPGATASVTYRLLP
jgi:uncharacterized protein (TIGR02001 family)